MFHNGDLTDKRIKIIHAAFKVFSQKGFHQAKVEEIAQEADVGKGTVYEYFSGKEELFWEMFRAGTEFYTATLQRELMPEMSLREKLKKIATLHLKFLEGHRDIARVIMQEHIQIGEKMHKMIKEARREKIDLLSGLFTRGIEEGLVRPMDTKILARMFIGAVTMVGGPVVMSGEQLDLDAVSEQIVSVFENGIKV